MSGSLMNSDESRAQRLHSSLQEVTDHCALSAEPHRSTDSQHSGSLGGKPAVSPLNLSTAKERNEKELVLCFLFPPPCFLS